MKKPILIIILFVFLINYNLIAQSIISEKPYLDKQVQTILLDGKYPIEIIKDGLKSHLINMGKSATFNLLNILTYKNMDLKKMPKDSSPYNKFIFKFQFENLGTGTKLSNFIYLIILDDKGQTIDFVKYQSLLESGKIWMDEFAKYFFDIFIIEREIKLAEEDLKNTKEFRIKTIKDSASTNDELQNKIAQYESELRILKSTHINQKIIFSNSIKLQKQIIDSLGIRIDSLKKLKK